MIIAGTGHRPDKLGGYDKEIYQKYYQLAYNWLKENQPTKVISGMAMGWDMALAEASQNLKIYTILAIPCKNQDIKWSGWWKEKYQIITFARANECHVLSETYTPYCMHKRNEWMVDRADKMLALWDGSKGGTYNCIQYANKKKKQVINLWEAYKNE